ncbi:MAG TPA: BON domain-containing protein [Acidimicrobiales bacterium]|nr:BON domain-containing protein [Acidimicrobiales bacterium]
MGKVVKGLTGGMMLAGGAVVFSCAPLNKVAGRLISDAGRRLRYLSGRLEGLSYAMEGRHPDPNVVDNVLADRIRSQLGGLEKRRDLPHIHVMVEDHVALLHGEVPTKEDADAIEKAVAAVSGVKAVKSHLHVGLINGDTRPSAGRAHTQT